MQCMPTQTVLIRAERLGFAYPGLTLLADLSFDISPGLTLVRGGDGRGKSTLLRLLAGVQPPTAGIVQRQAQTLFWVSPANPDDDPLTGRQWLAARRADFPAWNAQTEAMLVEQFDLSEHIGKPLYMLSTGSRRKAGLVAAAASCAPLTLVDMPYAALDAPSSRRVTRLLADASAHATRAWVIADHERPAALVGLRLAVVDLGD